MGKLKIGTRVRDNDGDEGVIVGKSKGYRDVKYDTGSCKGCTIANLPKSWLQPANDNVPATEDARPAIFENEYKVGDRVTMNEAESGEFTATPGTIRGKTTNGRFLVEFDSDVGFGHDGHGCAEDGVVLSTNRGWYIKPANLTPVVAPATTPAEVPKVGETVRFKNDKPESGAVYFEGELTVIKNYGETVEVRYPLFGSWDEDHLTQEVYPRDILPVAEQPAGESGEVVPKVGNSFKAGDRVRCDDNTGSPSHFVDGEIYTVKSVEGDDRSSLVWVEENESAMCAYRFSLAPPTTWSPVKGKYGTTRDGRKVGPIIVGQGEGKPWPWKTLDGSLWFRKDGFSCPGALHRHRDEDDLVAEWVEPAEPAPVVVAEASATPASLKVGDRVVVVACTGGRVNKVGETGSISSLPTFGDYGVRLDSGATLMFEPSELALATSTPPAKFKVGDHVEIVSAAIESKRGHIGREFTIERDLGKFDDGEQSWGGPMGGPHGAPIPERFAPSEHSAKEMTKAVARLTALKAMTEDDIAKEAAAWNETNDAYRIKCGLENTERRERYDNMISQTEAWQGAPEGLKEFMLQQLHSSRDFDTSDDPLKYATPPMSPDEWWSSECKDAAWKIEYHTKQDADERRRTDERNAWISQLRASLEPTP